MNANSDSGHAAWKWKQTEHITDNPDYDKPSANVSTPISVVALPKNVQATSKKLATQPTPSSSSCQATLDLPGTCSSGSHRWPKATIEESTDEEDYIANIQ